MAKFIYIDSNSRVLYVADARPNDATTADWIEVSNDSVQEQWYYDLSTQTLTEFKPYTIDEIRDMRNQKLTNTDWMVLEDSPYQESSQSSNLTAIKTYRQSLRDFPNPSTSYNEDNTVWPTLTLS